MLKKFFKKNKNKNSKKWGFLAIEYILILAILGVGSVSLYANHVNDIENAQEISGIAMSDDDAHLITQVGTKLEGDTITDFILEPEELDFDGVGETKKINASIIPSTVVNKTLVWTLTGSAGVVDVNDRNPFEVEFTSKRLGVTYYSVQPNGGGVPPKTVKIQVGMPEDVAINPKSTSIDKGTTTTLQIVASGADGLSNIEVIEWKFLQGEEIGSFSTNGDKTQLTFNANGTAPGGDVEFQVRYRDKRFSDSIKSAFASINVREIYYATFDAVYGNQSYANIKGALGSTVTIPETYNPIAEGRTFTGWRAQDGMLYQPGEVFTMTGEGWSFVAEYTANNYTVTWHRNYQDKIESTTTHAYATPLGELPVISRGGFTFDGWYTAAEGGTKITSTTPMPAQNVTYYAHWTRRYYTLSFDLNGGSGDISNYEVGYNLNQTIPNVIPTREHYDFNGWIDNNEWDYWYPGDSYKMPAKNITMQAEWTPITYTITWHKAGGEFINESTMPKSYTTEDRIVIPEGVTRTGYTFAGWYDNEDCTGNPVTSIEKGDGGNKDYWAKWTKNKYKLYVEAMGGTIEGQDIKEYEVEYASVISLPNPVRTGYTFAGWEDDTGTMISSNRKMPARDYELFATWTANKYRITFDPNGGSNFLDYLDVTYGQKIGTMSTPTRTNYSFLGWYTSKTGGTYYDSNTLYNVAGNITLYARWAARYTNITLRNDITGATTTKQIMVGNSIDVGELSAPGYKFKSYKSMNTYLLSVSGTKLTAIGEGNVTVASNWTLIHPGYEEREIGSWSCSAVTTEFTQSASPIAVNYFTGPSEDGGSTIDSCRYNQEGQYPSSGYYTNHGTSRTVTRQNGKYVCSKVCGQASNADGTNRCSEAKITWVGVSARKAEMYLSTMKDATGDELGHIVLMDIGGMAAGAKMTYVYMDSGATKWSSSVANPKYTHGETAMKIMYDQYWTEYDNKTGYSGYNQCETFNCYFRYYFRLQQERPEYDFLGGSFKCTERYSYSGKTYDESKS